MLSLFRAVFLIGAFYCSSVQAFSSTPIALAQFLASDQGATLRAQLNKLNPRNVPASTILLALSRQKEARNVVRQGSMRKTLAVFSAFFGGLKWCSGMLFSGIVLMKDGLGALASYFSKDAHMGILATATAGGFVYVVHQINQVRATQKDHTNRLGNLQSASSAIISTQATQGQQLMRVEAGVGELNVGQTRLEDSLSAAQSLLQQLNTTVASNGETLQGVSASVKDLVTRLGNVEQGVNTLNSGFVEFQTSFNESNATLNQRFTGFESTVFGLSSRVDDGVSKVEQLQLLVAECIEKTTQLFGENSEQVRSLRDELRRLAGKLDASLISLREEMNLSAKQLDENGQKRHDELKELLGQSSSQQQAISYRPGSITELLLRGDRPSASNNFLPRSSIPFGFPSGFNRGQQFSVDRSTGFGSSLSLTYQKDE